MFLKSIFDDVFKCNHHPRWLRNGSCGEFELGTSGRYACGFCLRVRHPPKPISSICAMVKTFLYHGYLDPFTKIDWCPSSNGCWFFMFFLDHLPSGYQKWLAGKSIRASSFGATACAWHAPRRSWTNQHRCGTLVFFLHLFKEGAIYSIYYPTYKGPTMNVLFD